MIRVASTKKHGISAARKESDKKRADDDNRMTKLRQQQRQNRRTIEERSIYSKCSLAMILPTTLMLTTGATITMCSTSPIIGGSLFYDSPKRNIYQITGGTLLAVGTVMMIVGYALHKYVRTGEERKLAEQKLLDAKQKAIMQTILVNQNATIYARLKKDRNKIQRSSGLYADDFAHSANSHVIGQTSSDPQRQTIHGHDKKRNTLSMSKRIEMCDASCQANLTKDKSTEVYTIVLAEVTPKQDASVACNIEHSS